MPSVVRIHLRPLNCGSSSDDRASAFHAEGREFEPRLPLLEKNEYLLDAPFSLLWGCQVLLLNYFLRLPRYSVTSLRKYTMVG